jgi:hypothetical protein
LDYDKWYALVMAITLETGGTGRIRIYVNGTLVLDRSQQTTNATPSIDHIILHGTIAQGSGAQQYDAPDHHRFMDMILFTDDLTYLTNAGLMSDPEAGGGGGRVTMFIGQGFIAVMSALQYLMILGYLWERRQKAIQALMAVHAAYWTWRYSRAIAKWQREAPIMVESRGEHIELTRQQEQDVWQFRK